MAQFVCFVARLGLSFSAWQLATFYTALQTKGFVILSGISGTGKTRLAQAFAGMLPQPAKGANHLFVTVRPDWRDSKSLLGYYNPLTGAYEWTPFLRFLLRAEQNYKSEDKLAWFVILDEMNLAHVEYYFADLLSVLESGRDEDGWTREPLRLGYPDDAAGDLPPRELRLPPNLYIVGTVNVDETTHAFSPKVLDRAFTLELTDVDFTTYPIPSASTQPGRSDHERKAILKDFARNDKFARVEKPTIMAYVTTHPEIRDRLQTLKNLLRPYDLHFGYRVFDEIVAFQVAAESNKLYDDQGGAEAAFDAAVLMKVLPKFHGSRSRLETPLSAVLAWCVNPGAPDVKAVEDALRDVGSDKTVQQAIESSLFLYPKTAERVQRMLARLHMDGFAAFG
jgi:5-methylcytosine-specific restriction endonuclease McrBC GTP-binding regulatory subunit McrB